LSNVTIAACAREDSVQFAKDIANVEELFSTHVERIFYCGAKVSSTRVRTLSALGEDVSKYICPKVGQYIIENGIYSIDNLKKVKSFLTEERWQHTLRVAVMCAQNCSMAHLNEEQAITMAALHDVAKYLPMDSPYLKGFKVDSDVPQPVVHQVAGAYVAGNYFKLQDGNLLNAIKYHTSGRENMTEAEALLFLCDMLEEGRNFEGVEELRTLFYEDLYKCLYTALAHQVVYLNSTGKPVYGLTQKAYEYLKEKYNDK
jgi:predicted HD superfamily hydrolase involved in NAD metabolism